MEQNKSWFQTSNRSFPMTVKLERRTGKIPGHGPKGTRAPALQVIKASIPPWTLMKQIPFFSKTSLFRRAGWVDRTDPRMLVVGHRIPS